jgi:hypothetical protein
MKFLVVAYYTRGTPYVQEAEELAENLQAMQLPHEIHGLVNRGSWIANCGQKPSFLLARAKAHSGLRMLYVDVDARFRLWPTLAESFQEDLLVHRRRGRELLSGTLLFQSNKRMLRLLEIWVASQKQAPRQWDQRVLQRVLSQYSSTLKLRVGQLPAEYVKIYDLMRPVRNPVIEHYQASRRYKTRVTRKGGNE